MIDGLLTLETIPQGEQDLLLHVVASTFGRAPTDARHHAADEPRVALGEMFERGVARWGGTIRLGQEGECPGGQIAPSDPGRRPIHDLLGMWSGTRSTKERSMVRA